MRTSSPPRWPATFSNPTTSTHRASLDATRACAVRTATAPLAPPLSARIVSHRSSPSSAATTGAGAICSEKKSLSVATTTASTSWASTPASSSASSPASRTQSRHELPSRRRANRTADPPSTQTSLDTGLVTSSPALVHRPGNSATSDSFDSGSGEHGPVHRQAVCHCARQSCRRASRRFAFVESSCTRPPSRDEPTRGASGMCMKSGRRTSRSQPPAAVRLHCRPASRED